MHLQLRKSDCVPQNANNYNGGDGFKYSLSPPVILSHADSFLLSFAGF